MPGFIIKSEDKQGLRYPYYCIRIILQIIYASKKLNWRDKKEPDVRKCIFKSLCSQIVFFHTNSKP